jgi:hypothetical protein
MQPAQDMLCSWVTADCPVAGVCDTLSPPLRRADAFFSAHVIGVVVLIFPLYSVNNTTFAAASLSL